MRDSNLKEQYVYLDWLFQQPSLTIDEINFISSCLHLVIFTTNRQSAYAYFSLHIASIVEAKSKITEYFIEI